MKCIVVAFIWLSGGAALFAQDGLLTQLMSPDRAARKDAAAQAATLSRQELVSLAQDAIDAGTLQERDRIYAFHRVLAIASEKGFGVADALALLDQEKSAEFKCAILDWLSESGVKGISPADALSLLPEVGRHFTDRAIDLALRLAAHSLCRELAWQARRMLNKGEVPNASESDRANASKEVRAHIEKVCRIIADGSEEDRSVESFAGYLPYYSRTYGQDGVYEKALLRSTVEQALGGKRGKKCTDALQAVLSELLKDEK